MNATATATATAAAAPTTTSNHARARHIACAIVDEANDLAGFLATAGDDLPADVAAEAAVLLDGVRQVLAGITARIGESGPATHVLP